MPVQPVVAPASKGLIPQPVSMSGSSVGFNLRKGQVAVWGQYCLQSWPCLVSALLPVIGA